MSLKKRENYLSNLNSVNMPQSNSECRQRLKETDPSNILLSDQTFDRIEGTNDEKPVRLTLMEELCLIALGDERATMSILNDNLPYVLRSCILLELTLAKRIKLNIYKEGNLAEAWKMIVTINDFMKTGDIFLDEALHIIAKKEFSLQKWNDVLTGETWSQSLSDYQMYNLRERICKSLMEKRIVTSKKSSFFLIETTEYPLLNIKLKQDLCFKIIDSVHDPCKLDLHALCLLLSLNGAKILHKALRVTDAPTTSLVKNFVNEALEKFSNIHNLESKFGHLLGDGEMYLISGIFSLYKKNNKFF